MFDEDLKHITLSGEEYPIKCDMLVLERLQEEFGSIEDFENRILGIEEKGKKRNKLPDVKAVGAALYWMIREGLEIEAEQQKKTGISLPRREQLMRKVDMPYYMLGVTLYEEFARCFASKNPETTRGETEKNPK